MFYDTSPIDADDDDDMLDMAELADLLGTPNFWRDATIDTQWDRFSQHYETCWFLAEHATAEGDDQGAAEYACTAEATARFLHTLGNA